MTTEQTRSEELLTAADFRESGYESVLLDEECPSASQRLRSAATEADEAGEAHRCDVLSLLADVTSMMLTPGDKANPFRPLAQFGNRRSAIPTDFSDHAIAIFAEITPTVRNLHLRARLADLVWLRGRRHGIAFCHLAIDTYRTLPLDADTWFSFGREYWARALTLSLSIGPGAGPRTAEIEASLISALFGMQDDGFVPLQIANLLFDNRMGLVRRADIAARMEALARAHAASGLHHKAIAYYEVAGKWYSRAGANSKAVEMVVETANCWENQGDVQGAGLGALHSYENAIKVFRTLPVISRAQYAVESRIDSLHGKVRAAGQATAGQMQTVQTGPIDITELVERARAMVSGKEPLEALEAFSHVYRGARVATIRATAERNLNASIFRQLAGSSVISSQGNTVARQPAANGSPEEAEVAIWAQMVRDYLLLVGLVAQGELEPALAAMRAEHMFTIWDFEELCRLSPFVPVDRVELMAEGLYAGYCGDMVHAVHLLVPQLENIVRVHLQHAGTITTTTSAEGIVMENGMSTLVKLPQMATVFGEDLTFELTALFCDQNGPNLRNEVAHGLISKNDCESAAGIYAWWLIFSLMYKTFWSAQERASQATATAATPEQGDITNPAPEV